MPLLRLIGLCLVFAQSALADTPCRIGAYVRPDVPGNPVVVDAPADGAADLGVMPMVNDADRGRMGASATITEVKNGYAAVTDIRPYQGQMLEQSGWVSARDLGFVVQTSKGFAAPDPASNVIWTGVDWISSDMFTTILDCKGEWVALQMADIAIAAPVWVRGTCAGQETTCDSVTGD